MTDKTQPSALPRYKIGYHSDEWGMRSSSPSGIPDPQGPWVRFEYAQKLITRVQQHEAELAAIGAGGVSGPLLGEAQAPAVPAVPDVAYAFAVLKQALTTDPDYVWSWHCNLAMPILDSGAYDPKAANIAAARLMRHLFDVDMESHPHYVDWMAQQLEQQT